MQKYLCLLLFVLFQTIIISACSDDLSFNDNKNVTLECVDSLKFKVLGDSQSEIQKATLYNRSNFNIHLKRIWLEKGQDSPFKVNVNGEILKDKAIEDIEILKKDSLFIFCFIKPHNPKSIEPIEDSDYLYIESSSGSITRITLHATIQGVTPITSLHINKDTLLRNGKPYHVLDSIVIDEGAQLTIEAGTKLFFHSSAKMIINGNLKAKGNLNKLIEFQSDKIGNIFNDTPYNALPGLWDGIIIRPNSFENILEYVTIHSSKFGIQCDPSDNLDKNKISIKNSIIHNTTTYNFSTINNKVELINCQITNAGKNCLYIIGGNTLIVHNTIAQFYPFSGGHQEALFFANDYDSEQEKTFPLNSLRIYNSIITGASHDDIKGIKSKSEIIPFNYQFSNCLINSEKVTDEHFVNCIWEDDKEKDITNADNFTPKFDYSKLLFTFQLAENSQAINNADPNISKKYAPYDFYGILRTPQNDDIGCYQYQPSKE